ncbi:MAG: hypothetical protein WD771_08450 [Gemmatimonadaceae bacterium]
MQHRHLLPQEIDLLVDGDVGFGVAPLRAHVDECAECRDRVASLGSVALALDALPHFAPRRDFSDQVMQQVQVIEPWHVAFAEGARRLIPTSAPIRALAAVGAGAAALAISGSAAWLAFRVDLAAWTYNVVLDRSREGLMAGAGALVRAAFADVPGASLTTIAVGTAVLALTALGALAGFRRLAAAARASRN